MLGGRVALMKWTFSSLQGLEQEAEEDVGGKQNEREDDGASQAAQGAHALGFLLLFLGFLLCRGLLLGGVALASEAGVAIGCGCLLHAGAMGRRSV